MVGAVVWLCGETTPRIMGVGGGGIWGWGKVCKENGIPIFHTPPPLGKTQESGGVHQKTTHQETKFMQLHPPIGHELASIDGIWEIKLRQGRGKLCQTLVKFIL